ncbi:MAG: hypothetical protein SEPTF4163_000831 [Sporothrix epigloea]
MAQALAMTLMSGQVDCKVSTNIRQQQYERLMGPIAFHTTSVVFETPNHAQLIEKVGVRQMILGILDELLNLARSQGCTFPPEFKDETIAESIKPQISESVMWQDYVARRPMEVETYLGSPIRLSQEAGIAVPRIESLYAILHNLNIINQTRPKSDPAVRPPGSPKAANNVPPRVSVQSNGGRPMANGMPPNGMNNRPPRGRNPSQGGPTGRRPPMSVGGSGPNGYGRSGPLNGYPQSRQPSRRGSMEGSDLQEFRHLVLYNDGPESSQGPPPQDSDLALRERELQLRQRELALREQEMRMRRSGPPPQALPRRGAPPSRNGGAMSVYDDEDEDGDFFDPGMATGPSIPPIDADNFDMMSVTSRKNRKAPGNTNSMQYRNNGDMGPVPNRGSRFRPTFGRNRSSQIIDQAPSTHSNIFDDPLMSCSSNRYANVDRGQMQVGSRTNSLTASRLEEMQYSGPGPMSHMGPMGPMSGPGGGPYPRRTAQSPGNQYNSSMRGGINSRPSPPNGYPGPPMSGRPSPPAAVRQPVPHYSPGHGNANVPLIIEQQAGVSPLQPPLGKNVRSLTGSASASAGSGDSHLDSEPSANSSQSSLGSRQLIGVQ